MACSQESAKLGPDDATNMTSLISPPHPSPPHPQWLPPPYPSAPFPDYSQVESSKAFQASNATGPCLYAVSQGSQPHLMLLMPYPRTSEGQAQQVNLVQNAPPVRSVQGQPSFVCHFIFSCAVFWCCGWLCGAIAFIVAMIAQISASSGNMTCARRLGYLSLALSFVGLAVGIIVTIVIIVELVQDFGEGSLSGESP